MPASTLVSQSGPATSMDSCAAHRDRQSAAAAWAAAEQTLRTLALSAPGRERISSMARIRTDVSSKSRRTPAFFIHTWRGWRCISAPCQTSKVQVLSRRSAHRADVLVQPGNGERLGDRADEDGHAQRAPEAQPLLARGRDDDAAGEVQRHCSHPGNETEQPLRRCTSVSAGTREGRAAGGRTKPVATKMPTAPAGGTCATMAMNQTKKSVSSFCRPTMMQTKPSAMRMALGATDDQFQRAMLYSCSATTGVNLAKRACSGGTAASSRSQLSLRMVWFSRLCGTLMRKHQTQLPVAEEACARAAGRA